MNTSLILRIDDRLIHGQVLVGWGTYYSFRHYIIGNDEIAAKEWERNLLLMAAPPEVDTQILTLAETVGYIRRNLEAEERSMVLVRNPADVQTMAAQGLPPMTVNIGGIHFEEGRKQFLPYLFLSEAEIVILQDLAAQGFIFECQDIPGSPIYKLASILEK